MKIKKLSDIEKGKKVKILTLRNNQENLFQRLLEIGFLEGSTIEILHKAPLGGDPIAVRICNSIFALGKNEATHIEVEEVFE